MQSAGGADALLYVEDWARAWAVPEVFGDRPGDALNLNDDRVSRALDAITGQLDAIKDRRADLKADPDRPAGGHRWPDPDHSPAYDGGAGEVDQVTGAMEALQGLAGERRFCWWATPS